ncbi:hypothetical protein MAR_004254 [Mya arenaria]|uniref:Uncharacterized protein n=1 Tax=Mya arenaria TaxID=6604 RepID=A0ABY7F087_MYAAR|nr:hypothetical protein MAR_004254 [Mya arenaria]
MAKTLSSTLHTLWSIFKGKLQTAIVSHTLHKMKSYKQQNLWITEEIKKLLKKKPRLYIKAKKHFQNECKKKIRRTEWDHINKKDYIGITPLRRQGNLVTDCKAKAEILVEQFQSVFTKDQGHRFHQPINEFLLICHQYILE